MNTFLIFKLHNCTIAQLLKHTGQECCAYYFDYPFATLQLATLQLAKRLVWMIMDELG